MRPTLVTWNSLPALWDWNNAGLSPRPALRSPTLRHKARTRRRRTPPPPPIPTTNPTQNTSTPATTTPHSKHDIDSQRDSENAVSNVLAEPKKQTQVRFETNVAVRLVRNPIQQDLWQTSVDISLQWTDTQQTDDIDCMSIKSLHRRRRDKHEQAASLAFGSSFLAENFVSAEPLSSAMFFRMVLLGKQARMFAGKNFSTLSWRQHSRR